MGDVTVRRGTKGQSVIEQLGSAIRTGRFAPGQRLIEAELTAEFRVSRGPVREAFRQLCADGLIELVPNRGALVRRLSRVEALELFQIRTELEALAARLAAKALALPGVKERFLQMTDTIWHDDPRPSTADYICENRRFHAAIYETARNRQLLRLNEQLQLSLIMAQLSPVLTSEVIASSLSEHRAISRAILAGDAGAADRAVRQHMRRACDVVRAAPDQLFRQDH